MLRILLVLLGLATAAHANVGRSSFPGTRTAEPAGLREIAIEREELRFDLRALDRGARDARITATYHLDNRGTTTVAASLVFVGGTSLRAVDISFDGAPLASEAVADAQIAAFPPAWSAPLTTPAFDGGAIGYASDEPAAAAFTLAIAPGKHRLVVDYQAAVASSKPRSSATIVYQLGYVLAPARDWGSFGTLEVSLDVPAGWEVATSPKLARSGDVLRGTFAALPGDTLGITARAATGMLHAVLQIALPLLALLVLAGGGYVLYRVGRRRGAEDVSPLWPTSLPVSVLWAVAIGVSGGLTALRGELAVPAGQSAAHGYGAGFGVVLAILVALIAIPVGVLLARAGRPGS